MGERFWHIRPDLLKVSADQALTGILSDDRANYEKASVDLKDALDLLDSSLKLYSTVMQGA